MKKFLKDNRVVLVGGSWSSNIGNAFYNLGAEWLLKNSGTDVQFFPESPKWKGKAEKHFDPVSLLNCSTVVLNGPCLWARLKDVYSSTFEKLYERGIKVAYLSAGMAFYTEQEADEVSEFLKKYPPSFVTTRDSEVYRLMAPRLDCPVYDGICTSMYLSDAHVPLVLDAEPYVIYNFDDIEPSLGFAEDGSARILKAKCRKLPTHHQAKMIVRTNNLSIDDGYRSIYGKPNTYHSDLPWGYCSIIAGADTVYSERVHTCASALIYGRKAQFIRKSTRSFEKRSLIFQRINVDDIFDRPTSLDAVYIQNEKDKMRQFIVEVMKNE